MATDRLYSQIVTGLKVTLPLAALGILTSLVYFARDSEEARRLPIAIGESDEFLRERVGRPEYLAVLDSGATLRLTADTVVPETGAENVYLGDNVAGRMVETSGRVIRLTAPDGRLDQRTSRADLTGIVTVNTSDGYQVLTDTVHARTDLAFAESGGPVWGEAPFGTLEADLMLYGAPPLIGQPGTESDPPLLHFTGNVKVIYEPRRGR